jgi:hypothetical protein
MRRLNRHLRSTGRNSAAIADELVEFGGNSIWHGFIIEYAQYIRNKVREDFKEFLEYCSKSGQLTLQSFNPGLREGFAHDCD